MEVRKSLEQKTLILGIEIRDLGFVLGLFFGMMLLIGLLRMVIPVSSWWNLAALLGISFYIGLVQYGLKHKHPSFLISVISYYFFQPKKVHMKKLDFIVKQKQVHGHGKNKTNH
ncbi:hypothetical protein GCM10027347_60600 [Larkinella harenae]